MSGPLVALDSLHQVALGVSDLERSIEFYRDRLGASLIAQFDPPGLAFFQMEGTRLLLERTRSPQPGSSVLYFRVAGIHDAFEELSARGVEFDSEPHRIHRDEAGVFGPSGEEEWMAFFRDPDGNTLALATRVPAAPPT